MPDQTLFDAASRGELTSKQQLAAQADRMLSDARAREQLGEFSLQWLRSDTLLSSNKDKTVYPEFSDSLREAMIQEQKRFFTGVVLDQRGSFQDLLLADYVIANQELAGFYGLSGGSQE